MDVSNINISNIDMCAIELNYTLKDAHVLPNCHRFFKFTINEASSASLLPLGTLYKHHVNHELQN